MQSLLKDSSLVILIFLLTFGLLILPIPSMVPALQAQDKSICEKQLTEAEQKYNTGRFDEAITLITECLGKPGITEQEKMKAYRLLGLSYIAKDYLDDAKTAVRKLLDMVPNYQSDPVQDPPPFTKLVEEVKEQQQPAKQEPKKVEELESLTQTAEKKGGSKKWYYIGGGVLAAGAIATVILLSGGDGNGVTTDNTLPGPPNLP